MLAAAYAKGKTVIKNCATEPEIVDLINFLKKLGTNIKLKNRTITIEKGEIKNSKINHKVIFDRIELGTFAIAGALLAKRNLTIDKIDPKIVKSEINLLKKIGVKIIKKNSSIIIKKNKKLKKLISLQNLSLGFQLIYKLS